jgi:hypothetical protein
VFCVAKIGLRFAALEFLWQNDFAVSPVFHHLSGHPCKSQKRIPVRILAVFQISYLFNLNSLREPALTLM